MPLFVVKETNKANTALHLEVWRAPHQRALLAHLPPLPAWSLYRERTIQCIETEAWDEEPERLFKLTQLP